MLCYGVNNRFLASSLLGAVSQRLVRRLCDDCKVPQDTKNLPFGLDDLGPWLEAAGTDHIYAAKGCKRCFFDGYTGRMALAEVLCGVPEIRRMVDEKAPLLEIQARGEELDMIDLRGAACRPSPRG